MEVLSREVKCVIGDRVSNHRTGEKRRTILSRQLVQVSDDIPRVTNVYSISVLKEPNKMT
ncbi:hypothetical protein J6590_090643 [Homalodisca vitripennis]|nr:hypothetical protein J6590_090643 [Homalodisca vitripennis]